MDLSDDSSLSSLSSVEDPEPPKTLKLKHGKLVAETSRPSPKSPKSSPEPETPEPEREPSPPHEYVLADNPDIAVIVMFRARFSDAFPSKMPHIGPQDIEQGLVEVQLTERIEQLLCALLGLVLNRKKYVERGHYGRALEDAVLSHRNQWPAAWGGMNPISGNKSFQTMSPTERLTLLKVLVLWSLSSSELIGEMIKASYKQSRHEDDRNQPLSVQSWGQDTKKRRYWLIEGQNDTAFRVYRESNPKLKNNTWWSVAGNVEELRTLSLLLGEEQSQAARRLAESMQAAIPRLEEGAVKRSKREYKQKNKERFNRDYTGVSLYAGRTRGMRPRYDLESYDEELTDSSFRRSSRQTGSNTPAEGPLTTLSGRQVRSRFGRSLGDAPDNDGAHDMSELNGDESDTSRRLGRGEARRTRVSTRPAAKGWAYLSDGEEGDDEDDLPSGDEWNGDDEDHTGRFDDEDDEEMSDNAEDDDMDSLMDEAPPRSKIIALSIPSWRQQVPQQLAPEQEQKFAESSLRQDMQAESQPIHQTTELAPSRGVTIQEQPISAQQGALSPGNHILAHKQEITNALTLEANHDTTTRPPETTLSPVSRNEPEVLAEPTIPPSIPSLPDDSNSSTTPYQNGFSKQQLFQANGDLHQEESIPPHLSNGISTGLHSEPALASPSNGASTSSSVALDAAPAITLPPFGSGQQQPVTLPFSPTKKPALLSPTGVTTEQPQPHTQEHVHAARPWEQ